jgi:nickel/cobalt exporter
VGEVDVRGFSPIQREISFQTMSSSTTILLASALSIGFFHTLLGPDHYLPFVAMARVGSWSKKKTLFITALCGVGHIVGSVVLGMVGIGLGFSLSRLEGFEASRGVWAAWALIGFGLLYTVWGIRRAARGHSHSHGHSHGDGTVHEHEHAHGKDHLHPHSLEAGSRMTPWVLFVIFLLGPCEALIPLLMFPAATESWSALFLVTGAFGIATLATMLGLVFLGLEGIQRLPFPNIGRYAHAAAGLTILLCGVAIQFLGI